jgi:hypothetical protein
MQAVRELERTDQVTSMGLINDDAHAARQGAQQ